MLSLRANLLVRPFAVTFAAVVSLVSASCMSWQDPGYPVEETIRRNRPSEMRVQLADGTEVELAGPVIKSDSLAGIPTYSGNGGPEWFTVPLSDVKGIEVKKSDGVATAALAVGVGAIVIIGIAAAVNAAEENEYTPPPSSGGGEPISCPLVYSWDGEAWRLDSGTFGGAFLRPLARTDVDLLEHAQATDGRLQLRLANELPETDHVDALELLVVDHEPGTEVLPDGSGALHVVGTLAEPTSARDDHGRDALAMVASVDGWGWESSPTGRDTSVATDVRSVLELEFDRPPGTAEATLVLHGSNTPWAAWLMQDFVAAHGRDTDSWYAAMNADAESSRALGEALAREAFLSVSVLTSEGWEARGLVWEAGPEVAKRQALRMSLAGVEGPTVRVRLESVPLYWNLDQVAIDYSTTAAPRARQVEPERVAMEADGRDVQILLNAVDGNELVLETGDAAVLSFSVPPIPEGQSRSYLIATTGWYRIHAPNSELPPRPELASIGTEPGAVSKLSVVRLNEAMTGLAARAALTTMSAQTVLGGRDGQ
jgi:hypothetical protein